MLAKVKFVGVGLKYEGLRPLNQTCFSTSEVKRIVQNKNGYVVLLPKLLNMAILTDSH